MLRLRIAEGHPRQLFLLAVMVIWTYGHCNLRISESMTMHCLRFCERNFQDHDMPVCFSQSDNKAQGVSKIPVANSKASSCMKLTKQLWVQLPSQSMCCNVALLPWLVEVETATDEMYDLHGPGSYALRPRARKWKGKAHKCVALGTLVRTDSC